MARSTHCTSAALSKSGTLRRTRPQRRIVGRARERGAAIFVVMMAVMLLTGLGSWVVYASGMAVSGAGNQRALAQTLYVAELGVLSGTGYLAQPGYAAANYNQAVSDLVENKPDDCQSVPDPGGLGDPRFCKAIHMVEIDTATVTDSTYTVLDLTAAGSMGPYNAVTEGSFLMEISDPRPYFSPGSDVSDDSYQKVTITSYGQVRPNTGGAVCAGATAQNSAATSLGVRAHAVIGPLD